MLQEVQEEKFVERHVKQFDSHTLQIVLLIIVVPILQFATQFEPYKKFGLTHERHILLELQVTQSP